MHQRNVDDLFNFEVVRNASTSESRQVQARSAMMAGARASNSGWRVPRNDALTFGNCPVHRTDEVAMASV